MFKAIGSGRLTAKPEVRYTENQTAWARFSLASDRGYHKEGEPDADFFDCKVFRSELAEFCEKYLDKGRKIVVYGNLRNDNYVNSKGEKVYRSVIIVDNIEFADSNPNAQNSAQNVNVAPAQNVQQTVAPAQNVQQTVKQNVKAQNVAPATQTQAAKNRATKPAQTQAPAAQPQPAPQQTGAPAQQTNFIDFAAFGDLPNLN